MAGILDIFDKACVLEDFAKVLEKTEILDFNVNIDEKAVSVDLKAGELIDKADLFSYIESTKTIYSLEKLDINLKYENLPFTEEYYQGVLFSLFKKCGTCKPFLSGSYIEADGKNIVIKGVSCGKGILEEKNCLPIINSIVSTELGDGYTISFDDEKFDVDAYNDKKDQLIKEIEKEAAKVIYKKEESEEKSAPEILTGLIYGSEIKEDPINISDVKLGMGICTVLCEVLEMDFREIQKTISLHLYPLTLI